LLKSIDEETSLIAKQKRQNLKEREDIACQDRKAQKIMSQSTGKFSFTRKESGQFNTTLESSPALCAYMQAKDNYWDAYDNAHRIAYDRNKQFEKTHRNLTKDHVQYACTEMFVACSEMLKEMIWAWRFDFGFKTALNLCSAPGGFDTVLAKQFPESTITSISLAEVSTGMAYLADEENVLFSEADVMKLVSQEWPNEDERAQQDLVILGGSSSGGSVKEEDRTMPTLDLLAAQCCVAYRCLRVGGTLMVRFSGLENFIPAGVFCLLADDFESVDVQKPSPESSGKMWSKSFVFVKFGHFRLNALDAVSKSVMFAGLIGHRSSRLEELCSQLTATNVQQLCKNCGMVWEQQAENFDNARIRLLRTLPAMGK